MRAFLRELLFQFHSWRLERMRARWRAGHYPVALLPRQRGFTLIELMVSVGIVAVLAGLAVTAYAGYSTKAAASEGIRLAEAATTAAASSYEDNGIWPLNNLSAGYIPQGGKYSAVSLDGNGNVAITYTANAPAPLAGTLTFMEPWLAPDLVTIVWTCGLQAGPPTIAASAQTVGGPATPLFSGSAIAATTTPAAYLPRNCHP